MKHIIALLLLWLACFGLASCGAEPGGLFSYDYTPAQLAKASEVRSCESLGEITGYTETTSSRNVPLARMTARDDMLDRAGRKGATHVVFIKFFGSRKPMAVGEAYKCSK